MATTASYDELLASATEVKHKTEFRSNADEALKLTVRQDVTRKAGFKKLGRSVLVFDFQPAGAITSTNSPNNVMDAPAHESSTVMAEGALRAAAVDTAGRAGGDWSARAGPGEGEEGSGESTGVTSASSVCVVFVHNRYNGAKQLYVNRALAYSVKKECTDGNLNSWVIPLPFGRAVLRLTSKLFASSGFEYVMTLDNHDRGGGGGGRGGRGTVLYKSTQ
ncbi:hypothetical protein Esi_0185_0037 [Ectocarpus siliculosus]|uniref:Uncharacterized protein n=1 Tax=Ectocarpus siliculosus TaxID=2880 RepID=D7FP45_ECTSI|nr:hypothetical protein Esi_0185_0037 [Ectocarpus siliculosus]|eukprot:CBJ30309.1 hypothetical protein Esi_0185_0037 [Ectocarpus siliculosus]